VATVCEAIAGEITEGVAGVAAAGLIEAVGSVWVATVVGETTGLAAEACVPATGETADTAEGEPAAASPLDDDCGVLDDAVAT
jgi:hypothetical protein